MLLVGYNRPKSAGQFGMKSPENNLLRMLEERDPASPEFWRAVRAARRHENAPSPEIGMWRDVFVEPRLPWGRFAQSAVLHTMAIALIWTVSASWIRQQRILDRPAFDRSSLVTYSPDEYLPPLDTGRSEVVRRSGDPSYARQQILSVPAEAKSSTQTIVAPPNLKLDHDVPMPNIVASGAIVPAVPLDATRVAMKSVVAPETQIVAPAPDVQFAPERVVRTALKSDVIGPPPEVNQRQTRGLARPDTVIVEPPPELAQSTRGHAGVMNIGPSAVVAPAPQLPVAEQHSLAVRGSGRLAGGSVQAVAPPPSVTVSGNARAGGRLIALGIHPVTPTGPVAVPAGNRGGTFAANPQGKAGAAGTPHLTGTKADVRGTGGHSDGSLPAGLKVGASPGASSPVERNGRSTSGSSAGNGTAGATEMANLSSDRVGSRKGARAASPVAEDKITEEDRQVFGGRRPYEMTLNLPNLTSSTGSWEIRFAELTEGRKDGSLLAPIATEQSDPGYPLELIRSNVHGMVTLYAVIRSDGRVGNIRVLNSPDDRLDAYAASALARWKFLPAERAGKPVSLEAVVKIPFKVRRSF
jgi:TonB family protein